jgi:S-adenosylmethionine:tRNA ribosyltransferase-isomerase
VEKVFSVESYNYEFDNSLIAKEPIQPKESAKLLIYFRDTKKIIHSSFGELLNFIPKDTAFIFNNTKVIKARIFGKKESSGKVEVLINRDLGNFQVSIFVRGKVRVGTKINFENKLQLEILELLSDGSRIGKFSKFGKDLQFSELIPAIEEIGHIPLPPYISRDDTVSDEVDYQTVFAKESGAVASPTASLHFSENMMKNIEEKFDVGYLTLHVGAGTFKPVEVEDIRNHNLHKEIFSISKKAENLINSKNKILAVGTTVTRTVEYFIRSGENFGDADIFLHPENKPKRVDYLLTNFHLPKSTLLMLVSSFIGIEEMQRIYKEAIRQKYRFYSYGDAMLIL